MHAAGVRAATAARSAAAVAPDRAHSPSPPSFPYRLPPRTPPSRGTMRLLDHELAALQRSGVASAELVDWVRSEQHKKREAEEKFADAEGAGSLFACSSDSSADEGSDEESLGYDLPTARWAEPGSAVEVWYALARGAAFGHGDEVWAAAIYLSEQLCDEAGRRALLPAPSGAAAPDGAALGGYRILEVGAGCAIPSWVCTQLGAGVAASDYPSLPTVTAMLRAALLNGHGADAVGAAAGASSPRAHDGRVEVVGHEWGASVAPLLGALDAPAEGGQRYDVAVVCDCIYDPSGHDPLLRTLCDTLRPAGVALVAFSLHGNVEDDNVWAFFARAVECGLTVEHVAEEDMHPELVGQPERQDDAAATDAAGLDGKQAGRECLSRRRGAKRNKVYMSRMLAPAESPAQFRAPNPTPVPVPTAGEVNDRDTEAESGPGRGEIQGDGSARTSRCVVEGVGPMQHGVGLSSDTADAAEHMASVIVKQVPGRGRCVFASAPIKRGELIEIAPCLRFPRAQYEALQLAQTPLEHYVFVERGTRDLLLALGIGSLFNHSETPNVDYRVDPPAPLVPGARTTDKDPSSSASPQADPQGRVTFRCARPVAVGEELCIYYGPDLWFEENRQVEAE